MDIRYVPDTGNPVPGSEPPYNVHSARRPGRGRRFRDQHLVRGSVAGSLMKVLPQNDQPSMKHLRNQAGKTLTLGVSTCPPGPQRRIRPKGMDMWSHPEKSRLARRVLGAPGPKETG